MRLSLLYEGFLDWGKGKSSIPILKGELERPPDPNEPPFRPSEDPEANTVLRYMLRSNYVKDPMTGGQQSKYFLKAWPIFKEYGWTQNTEELRFPDLNQQEWSKGDDTITIRADGTMKVDIGSLSNYYTNYTVKDLPFVMRMLSKEDIH